MYTYTGSPYEIEDRGTSGNTASEDISIEQRDFFLDGGPLSVVRCTIKFGAVRLIIQ